MADLYYPTRLDLRNRVRFYIDEPVQANFKDTDINYALNEAQQDVCSEIDQVGEKFRVNPVPTVIQLATNVQYYDLPDDCWKITRVQDGITGLPIDFTDVNSQNDYFQGFPPLITTYPFGGFSCFIIGGNQGSSSQGIQGGMSLGFTPIPTDSTKTVKIWYVPIMQDMDSDEDVCAIPRQLSDMLALQAAIDCYIKDEDDPTQLINKYDRRLDQLKRIARDRQQQTPKYVRRTGNSQGYPGYYI